MSAVPQLQAQTTRVFCCPELRSTNPSASTAFYGELFGWSVRESLLGPLGPYFTFHADGSQRAGMCVLGPGPVRGGIATQWLSNVACDEVDAEVERALSLGAQILAAPQSVTDRGRVAEIRDPAGSVLCLWEGWGHAGIGATGPPGTLAWTQLNTPSPEAVRRFYTSLFGWRHRREVLRSGHAYTRWRTECGDFGGATATYDGGIGGSQWIPFFAVRDVAASHALASRLGAKTFVLPSRALSIGQCAVLRDPLGATFGLIRRRATAASEGGSRHAP